MSLVYIIKAVDMICVNVNMIAQQNSYSWAQDRTPISKL